MKDYTKSYITDKFIIETGDEFTYTINNNDNLNTTYTEEDYLHKIFIRLSLPSIYSSSNRQFKWIKYLGYNIIKNVTCYIKFKNPQKNEAGGVRSSCQLVALLPLRSAPAKRTPGSSGVARRLSGHVRRGPAFCCGGAEPPLLS